VVCNKIITEFCYKNTYIHVSIFFEYFILTIYVLLLVGNITKLIYTFIYCIYCITYYLLLITMNILKINREHLVQRDLDFIQDIINALSKGFYLQKFFICNDDDNDDDDDNGDKKINHPDFIKRVFAIERKRFAQWKLKQIQKEKQKLIDLQLYTIKQQRDLLLHQIQKEKFALYKTFITLPQYHWYWRPYWENYYLSKTTFFTQLSLFTQDELITWYDWHNGIYI